MSRFFNVDAVRSWCNKVAVEWTWSKSEEHWILLFETCLHKSKCHNHLNVNFFINSIKKYITGLQVAP